MNSAEIDDILTDLLNFKITREEARDRILKLKDKELYGNK